MAVVRRGGLNARYYNNRWLQGKPSVARVDRSINFHWGDGLVSADAADFVSAQYDGYLRAGEPANYTFHVTVDDGVKLWLDDVLLLSRDAPGAFSSEPVPLALTYLIHEESI